MGLAKLNQLYRELVLDHAEHPQHYGNLPEATGQVELSNPTCGDVLAVQAQISDGQIKKLAFHGDGCTISQASASMMTTALTGQSVPRARQLIADFADLTMGQPISDAADDELGDAAVLGTVAQFPARIKCATLAWHALDEVLANEEVDGDE